MSKRLLLPLWLLILSGCDGGLFGTGTGSGGSGVIIDAAPEGSNSGDQTGGMSPDPGADEGDGEPSESDNISSTIINGSSWPAGTATSWVNSSGDGSADSPAQWRLVNNSCEGLSLTIDGGAALSFEAYSISDTLSVPAGNRPLQLNSLDGMARLTLNPAELAAGSFTLLSANAEHSRMLVLQGRRDRPDGTLALVRIVWPGASLEGDADTLFLEPLSGGVDTITVDSLDMARPASDYILVPAGEYRVIDTAGLIGENSVRLGGGQIGTLLLADPRVIEPHADESDCSAASALGVVWLPEAS